MPGWYLHLDIARKAIDDLKLLQGDPQALAILANGQGPTALDIAQIAENNPAYFALGAIGPDLFFLLPDFLPPEGNFLYSAAHLIRNIYTPIDDHFIGPITDQFTAISMNLNDELNALTGGLIATLGTTISELGSVINDAVISVGANTYDIWGLLGSGVPKAYDEQSFYWSDMLHYRKTYDCAATLWSQAMKASPSDVPRFQAFALGWMTHLPADVTGHAFVNEKCGGPYRLHWQRHHIIENHMDAQVYLLDEGTKVRCSGTANYCSFGQPNNCDPAGEPNYQEITAAAMHLWIAFEDNPPDSHTSMFNPLDPKRPAYRPAEDTCSNLFRRHFWDYDSDMPDDLAQFLASALKLTYDSPGTPPNYAWAAHPTVLNSLKVPSSLSSFGVSPNVDGFPTPDDIATTYFWLYKYVKWTTTDYFRFIPPEPPQALSLPQFPSFPTAGITLKPIGSTTDALTDAVEIAAALLALLAFLFEVVLWAVAYVANFVTGPKTQGLREFVYKYLELPLYNAEMALHWYLSILGYTYPLQSEIAPELTTLGIGYEDIFGTIQQHLLNPFGGLFNPVVGAEPSGADRDLTFPNDCVTDPKSAIQPVVPFAPVSTPCGPDVVGLFRGDAPSGFRRPWHWPDKDIEGDDIGSEKPLCGPASPYRSGQDATVLMGSASGTDIVRQALEGAQNEASTITLSTQYLNQSPTPAHLGDPAEYAKYVIARLTRDTLPSPLANFNLDADRGYGHLCWDWVRSHCTRGVPKAFTSDGTHRYQAPLFPGYGWCSQELDRTNLAMCSHADLPFDHNPASDPTNPDVKIRYIDREPR